MVHASTHMESVSMRGWASSPRYRATQYQYHHVPFYLPPPDHHHLPDGLHLSKEPQVAPFHQDHDSPWDSLGSSGAPGAHLAPPPQSEDKSQRSESRKDNDNKALSKGSPLCPRDGIPQGWLSSRVVPPLSPPVPSFSPSCSSCWHQGGLDERPSPF
jgi:hypothetical protein